MFIYAEYKKLLDEGNKVCFRCENGRHSKKYKYFTHGYNAVFWLCSSCLKELGSTNKVMEYLEAVPIPYKCLNYASYSPTRATTPTVALVKNTPGNGDINERNKTCQVVKARKNKNGNTKRNGIIQNVRGGNK